MTSPRWHLYVPKLYTVLSQGYSATDLRHDAVAGLTVSIVALPLAMALAIASGTTPDKGLITAVVAGALISALGGSRFQIGGPTGAFVVVVFNVIQQHGYDGLLLATLMAGTMLVIAGLAGLGAWIKYIPEPVVTGFTAGIAVIIMTSQIKDFFGLAADPLPADFFAKLEVLWQARGSIQPWTLAIALGTLGVIVSLNRAGSKLPAFLVALIAAALVVEAAELPIDTIGSRFGSIEGGLALPQLPALDMTRLRELLPSAFTIAFLAGVESLLSAVVADGMTGRRHRSNCELVAQGVANAASALFGGLPATGAIARTATNIRSGARSPLAGVLHAMFLLLFMLVLAPLARFVPLAGLAAVLVVVAWNMSEIHRIRYLLTGPWGDRVVLALTFGLTVAVDLTFAIQVGVVLAAALFMHRMTGVVAISGGDTAIVADDMDDFTRRRSDYDQRAELPHGVEVFQLRGPLFFGVANRLSDVIDDIAGSQRAFILRMRDVPLVDSTGAGRLREFVRKCHRHGTIVILSGLQAQPAAILRQMRVIEDADVAGGHVRLADDFASAIELARSLTGTAAETETP